MRDCAFLHARNTPPRHRSREDGREELEEGECARSPLRTIVIDGMNLAHAWAAGLPDARPIVEAVWFFERAGFRVLIFLPVWAYRGTRHGFGAIANCRILTKFERTGQLCLAPAREDDDIFTLTFSRSRRDTYVLSNDCYEKHISSNLVTRSWVATCVIKFMFADRMLIPSKQF